MSAQQPSKKLGGYLFMAAGAAFFVAAALGRQIAFAGVGVAFIAIGARMVRQSKNAS